MEGRPSTKEAEEESTRAIYRHRHTVVLAYGTAAAKEAKHGDSATDSNENDRRREEVIACMRVFKGAQRVVQKRTENVDVRAVADLYDCASDEQCHAAQLQRRRVRL